MILRDIDLGKDYPSLLSFWTAKGQPTVPESLMPPIGLCAEEEGTLICGAFLALSDAGVGSVGFIAANPKADASERDQGLDMVLLALLDRAKKMGIKWVSAATNVTALQNRYEKLGFFKTDENVVHYARRV